MDMMDGKYGTIAIWDGRTIRMIMSDGNRTIHRWTRLLWARHYHLNLRYSKRTCQLVLENTDDFANQYITYDDHMVETTLDVVVGGFTGSTFPRPEGPTARARSARSTRFVLESPLGSSLLPTLSAHVRMYRFGSLTRSPSTRRVKTR